MWNVFSRLAAAEAELGEVRGLLRDAVEGLQVRSTENSFTRLMLLVKHDWTEPPTNETGGHWISWQRVRCNKRGGELAGIAPRGDGLLVPGELWEGKLPGETLLLSTSATALNKKEILFWPCTEISSKEIICSASSVIFMKI